MNRWSIQVGPTAQLSQTATQLTPDTMWNQTAGTANNSCLYRTSDTDAQPPPKAHFTFHRQMSNWKTLAVPHQAVSSMQPARKWTPSGYVNHLQCVLSKSSENTQRGNPPLQVTSGLQVANQQDFYQNSSTQRPPYTMQTNTTCPQQDMTGHFSQQSIGHLRPSIRTDDRNVVSAPHGQNGMHGFLPPYSSPSYNHFHHFRNNNITTNASPSGEILHFSGIGQKIQQYSIHANSTHNNGAEAFLSKTNELPLSPDAVTEKQIIIARLAENLRESFTASSGSCLPVCSSSPYKESQSMSKVRMTETKKPVEMTGSYNSNALQSLPIHSGLSLPKATHSPLPRTQPSVDVSQQRSVRNDFHVTTTGDGSGYKDMEANTVFHKSNNVSKDSLLGSMSSSDAPEMHMRAVAVVQPMSPAVAENEKALYFREGSKNYPDHQNQMKSNTSVTSHSAACYDSTLLSPTDSAGHQVLTQQKLCADDRGSNLAVDQHVSPTAQQSVTSQVLVNQRGNNDNSKSPNYPKSGVYELSSIPAISWTAAALKYVVEDAEKVEKNVPVFDSGSQILNMFWDGMSKNLACLLKTGWYKDLITDVHTFCDKYLEPDSVILTQISFEEQIKNFHVLKEDTVYSELPYKSSWLNFNEQLDDIDKEFGMPLSLKHCLHMFESHSQADQVGTVSNMPAERVSEVPNKVSVQTEGEPCDPGEEQQPLTAEATSNETDAVSSDPYSFKIQVLSPEEAKVIFEQVQSKMPQSMATVSQPERGMNSSAEDELPDAVDVTLKDSNLDKSICPVKEICCIFKLLETTIQKKENPCAEGEQAKENIENNQIKTYNQSCCQFSQPIAATENNHKSHLYSDKDSGDEDLSGSESHTKLAKKMENLPSSEDEVANQKSDLEEYCGKALLTSANVVESPLKTEEHTQMNATAVPQTSFSLSGQHKTIKRKQKGSHDRFSPFLKTTKKCKLPVDVESQPSKRRKPSCDVVDRKPLASNTGGVQLVLFGSAQQSKSTLFSSRRTHISSPEGVSESVPEPPKRLSVKPGPLRKRKTCEWEHSVKECSFKKWKSFTKMIHKRKTQNYMCSSLSGLSPRKTAKGGSTNTEKLPVSSEMRRLKRRRMSPSGTFKHEVKVVKKKKDEVTLRQPVYQRRSKPLHENNVLRFSVLPNTFNFKDGSNERKETSELPPNKTDLVGGMNKRPNKTIAREKGTWCPNPEKKNGSLRTPPALKTSSLFHEFQRKYRKRTQPSKAE